MHIVIKPYSPQFAHQIADLFTQTVHSIDDSLYNSAQKSAWAPIPPNYQRWKQRLAERQPFVAWVQEDQKERLAGFIELEPSGHIDCFYVAQEFQGTGVASALLRHLLSQAQQASIKTLFVEASKAARPMFAHYGFTLEKQNAVERNGQILTNYSMSLHNVS